MAPEKNHLRASEGTSDCIVHMPGGESDTGPVHEIVVVFLPYPSRNTASELTKGAEVCVEG